MPEFSGQIRHSNQNLPVLDLTDGANQFNQTGKSPVKGIGVFSDIPSRSAITQRYRSKGYLAVVDSSAYVYTNSSVSDSAWEEEGNWAGLSAANGLPTGGDQNNVLVKKNDSNYQATWTGDPIFSSNTLKKQIILNSHSRAQDKRQQKTRQSWEGFRQVESPLTVIMMSH